MKKFVAITLCALLVFCIGNVFLPQTSDTTEARYYSTDFYGASAFVEKTAIVNYSDYSEYNKSLALIAPGYIPAGVTCVPTATTNLLGYYDRYYTELIPNFTPGTAIGDHYVYNRDGDEVSQTAVQVAKDMGMVNLTKEGATVSEFKSGLTKYCNRISLNVNYTSSMKSGKFSYETAKTQLLSGLPLIIFCSEFNITNVMKGTNKDTLTLFTSTDAHAMAVFGYTEITYILSDGSTRVDNYLRVATGVPSMPKGLVYMGSDLKIDDAYAVKIY